MNIQALTAFVTVAHEGSLTRAAEKLHLTQPAVGLQIKNLQEQTNLCLFHRTAQGMRLTHDGAALLPLAEKVLQAQAGFKSAASSLHNEVRGNLKIGSILDPEFIRLGALLKELTRSTRLVKIALVHGMSGDALARVKNEELDAGFYLHVPATQDSGDSHPRDIGDDAASPIAMKTLTRFTYRVVAPAGWELQMQGRNWAGLGALPWLSTPPASVHHRLLEHVFGTDALAALDMKSVAMVDQEASMLDLVKSGVGLSLMRDHIALREAQAHGLAIADAVSLDCILGFVYMHERSQDPIISSALAALDKVWPNAGYAERALPR
jgi:DNA-binding transcriptional LysR family regulator